MTDTTQGEGASPVADELLFQEATDGTLEEFENPKETPAEKPVEKPPEKPPETPPAPPEKPAEENSLLQRLREEGERARRAERERDENAARLAQFVRPPQQQEKPDLFADPEKYVMSVIKPLLDQQDQQRQLEREQYSMDTAVQRFGGEMVAHSRGALEHFMQRGDPQAWDTYHRAMKSHDPYGVIAGWFHERTVLHQVGGDLNAFRKREREEALKDPEFLKSALEHARKSASANGNFANRPPVNAAIPNMPSLGNIGAGGGDTAPVEPSDQEYFRAATSAKRR
jgi:hypothetical protein